MVFDYLHIFIPSSKYWQLSIWNFPCLPQHCFPAIREHNKYYYHSVRTLYRWKFTEFSVQVNWAIRFKMFIPSWTFTVFVFKSRQEVLPPHPWVYWHIIPLFLQLRKINCWKLLHFSALSLTIFLPLRVHVKTVQWKLR